MRIRHLLSILFALAIDNTLVAQDVPPVPDTVVQLKEIVVISTSEFIRQNTTVHKEFPDMKLLNQKLPNSLTDALAKIPGISQISTGPSISKPVIQGLYGNRIYVGLSGIRFENQQWQDEHGLGLSMPGISGIQIVKGAASLLYGSEAIGGAILIEEEKGESGQGFAEGGISAATNSGVFKADVAFSPKMEKNWAIFRAGVESAADFGDAHHNRILNSRYSGYFLKTGLGLKHKKWDQEIHFQSSFNQFGFILEELNTFFDADARGSRAMAGPHHNVFLNLLSVQNHIPLENSTLTVDLGAHSNVRQEDEGGGAISLNMHLLSLNGNVRWDKALLRNLHFRAAYQGTYSNNTNYGGRILIPDANTIEHNGSLYLLARRNCTRIELGISAASKGIETFQTRTLNSPGQEISPFHKTKYAVNGMFGYTHKFSKTLGVKFNFGTGYRAANLAELSSNGLHEGVYRYEIGYPNLKAEKNLNLDLSLSWNPGKFRFYASGFLNHFDDYIYLAPTNETYFGFPVFRYRQAEAKLFGTEIRGSWNPTLFPNINVKSSVSAIKGILKQNENLPFIAPLTNRNSIRYETDSSSNSLYFYIEPEVQIAAAQNHPALFETKTAAYTLLNLYAGIMVPGRTGNWDISIACNNLGNRQYADHLSRLKNYGISNPGIQLILSVRKKFGF